MNAQAYTDLLTYLVRMAYIPLLTLYYAFPYTPLTVHAKSSRSVLDLIT